MVGVASEEWGQSVVAVLEGRALAPLIPEIQSFVRERLATFQVPRRWVIQEKLARSSLGKVSRHRVKESLGECMHRHLQTGGSPPVWIAMKESEE